MSNQKPVSKYDYMKADDMFEEIANRCSYIESDLVRTVYYELVRLMGKQLKDKGMVRMPEWGDFHLIYHKERDMKHVRSGDTIHIPAKKTVKYVPNYKLKNHFNRL